MCTHMCAHVYASVTHVYTYVYTSYVLTGHCVVCQGGVLTYYISVVVMTSDVYTCVYTNHPNLKHDNSIVYHHCMTAMHSSA